jgi:hypothetical protein
VLLHDEEAETASILLWERKETSFQGVETKVSDTASHLSNELRLIVS